MRYINLHFTYFTYFLWAYLSMCHVMFAARWRRQQWDGVLWCLWYLRPPSNQSSYMHTFVSCLLKLQYFTCLLWSWFLFHWTNSLASCVCISPVLLSGPYEGHWFWQSLPYLGGEHHPKASSSARTTKWACCAGFGSHHKDSCSRLFESL